MMKRVLTTSILGLSLLTSAHAAPVVFFGIDPAVTAGEPRTKTDLAAANFKTAVSNIGTVQSIDFESVATVGPFMSENIGPGVTATLVNAYKYPGSPRYAGINDYKGDSYSGYNTTVAGSHYLRVVPDSSPTTSLTFTFDTPVLAFGLYLTGLGSGSGMLHVLFDDGKPEDLLVTGNKEGGIAFFGFLSDGMAMNSVTFRLQDIKEGIAADAIGVDDLFYATADRRDLPEPGSFLLAGVALCGVVGARKKKS